ncbi:MAG: ribonuclease R [Chlorobiota bacterium]|nr:MAG: ribonuclease R [Chlorobiota bacterium]
MNKNTNTKSIKEVILNIIQENSPNRLKSNQLSKTLQIKSTDNDYELVKLALVELINEGKIYQGAHRTYGFVIPTLIIEGLYESVGRAGGGIVKSNIDDSQLLIIDKDSTWNALHGDFVRAKLIKISNNEKPSKGEITRVISRNTETITGTIFQSNKNSLFLQPDDKKLGIDFLIRRKNINNARIGDKVESKLLEWFDPEELPEVSVIRVLGKAGEVRTELKSVHYTYKLKNEFPINVTNEANNFTNDISSIEISKRKDLRSINTFTIDPDDAKDFDDAISIQKVNENEFILGIHIADVSHFVTEDSCLDKEALSRGTSVYLVGEVIPMLPEHLSNDLCSLKPNIDRLTFSVLVKINLNSEILDYEICKSIIHSKKRFTYNQVLEIINGVDDELKDDILLINKIAIELRNKRKEKGSTDFDTSETKFILDETGRPVEVIHKKANAATKLIEDCMLLANRIVAEHITMKKTGNSKQGKRDSRFAPFIYRIHDSPPSDKIRDFSNFLKSLGLTFPKENIKPLDYKKLIEKVRGTENEEIVNEMAIRSMAKAVYSNNNIGHFGLAFDNYSHFTSPIRRYPDLIVHRMLNEYINDMSIQRRNHYKSILDHICDQCSLTERNSVEAERESIKIAETYFMKSKIGNEYTAVITGMMPYAIFAKIDLFGIEGKIRIKDITDDYYVYDETKKMFVGKRKKRVFKLRDKVKIRVLKVDEVETFIDFTIV